VKAGELDHLEDATAATIAWQDAQDARTTELLARWEHGDALRKLVSSLPTPRATAAPWHCGERWFGIEEPGSRLTASGPDGPPITLVDPTREAGHTLRDFWPSPDGALVVIATVHGSAEAGDLRFLGAATGEHLGSPALYTTMTRVEWLPDSTAIVFNGVTFEGDEMRGAIYEWTPGDDPVLQPITSPTLDLYAKPANDGRRILISSGNHRYRPVAVIDREAKTSVEIAFPADVHLDGVIVDDELIAITTEGADRGRVIRTALDRIADTSAWTEVSPESAAALRAISVVGPHHLALSELVDGCGGLRLIDLRTSQQSKVALPRRGALATSGLAAPIIGLPMCRVSGQHAELTFLLSSPATPPAAYRYDITRSVLEALGPEDATDDVVDETVVAISPDGTRVPCVLVHSRALDRQLPAPTLVLAYGGFNLPNTPRYQLAAAAFVASGGIVAYPLLRGGGEFGNAWWEAGRGRNKQRTFDDLYAVCEALIDTGVTTNEQLALQGGSNGGITASAAAAQRPDLFAAVVATAPLTDLLRHHRAALSDVTTAATIAEFGDPDDPGDATAIAQWSPFLNVVAADDGPAVLVAAAEDDVRTPPWHARKFVARLQAERPNSDALLRIWRNYGHGTGGGSASDRTAEWLGFVMSHVGVVPAE
jgi:prolyl oligopeptidase